MRLTRFLFSVMRQDVSGLVDRLSTYNPTPLSMKQLIDFGKHASLYKSCLFLSTELPIRLANIMQEIELLPKPLLEAPSTQTLMTWYSDTLMDLEKYRDEDFKLSPSLQKEFSLDLEKIKRKHTYVVETMAQGLLDLEDVGFFQQVATRNLVQYFLDRFYLSRISIRLLISQHLSLYGADAIRGSDLIGVIDLQCNVEKLIKYAYEDAKYLCDFYHGDSPELSLRFDGEDRKQSPPFVYIPSHLHHMVFELFKNAMRAVVEFNGNSGRKLPRIKVHVSHSKRDLTIRISDRGGGFSYNETEKLFLYMYTTAKRPSDVESLMKQEMVPLAGLGYGLSLSRLYARYFHGDLCLSSMDGYGTDAYLYLKSNPADGEELLPVYSRTSRRQYTDALPVSDWTNPNFTTGLRVPHKPQTRKDD